MKPSVILFDVNETLLDMAPLKKKVNKILDSKRGFRIWFGMLLQYAMVDNCTGQYHDFSAIADAALHMTAKALKKDIDEDGKKEALSMMKEMPAHPDVKEGLTLLKEAGYRLATLTNSPPQSLSAQSQHAGLTELFEQTFSVDAVRKYKPAAEPYLYAAHAMGGSVMETMLVAAHGWDIAGALHAGLQAAFIERKGQSLYPLAPKPHFTGSSLTEVAQQIIQQYKESNE